MLEFKEVSKIFGEIEALRDVSFEVEPGELVFITGASGAGKTTLLRLLIREFMPTSGEIILDEVVVNKLRRKEIPKLRQNIGSVFQDYKLLSERTVFENAETALAIKGVQKSEWEERVNEVLKLVGLEERANLFPSQLSGGELQRAALARALVVNPKLIFADEPTGNLDLETGEEIMKLLAKIKDEGKTVLVATHNKEFLEKYGARILKLEKGKLVDDSKPKKKEKKE